MSKEQLIVLEMIERIDGIMRIMENRLDEWIENNEKMHG